MSKTLAQYVALEERKNKDRDRKELSREERHALHRLRKEARAAGAVLKSAGRGGLSPSLVLHVFRRDEYKCKVHGDRGEAENGGLTLHHKGGIVDGERMSQLGHKNIPQNLVTVCNRAHDALHNDARERGIDSSQVEPEGDK